MKKIILIGFSIAFVFPTQCFITGEAGPRLALLMAGRFPRADITPPLWKAGGGLLPTRPVERFLLRYPMNITEKLLASRGLPAWQMQEGRVRTNIDQEQETGVTGSASNASPKGNRAGEPWWWLLLTLLLVICSLYLLYRVRKKQVVNEQLNVLRRQMKALFDNAPCGYHVVDDQGYIVDINNTLLNWLGYEREDVAGKLKFADMVVESDIPVTQDLPALMKGHVDVDLKKKAGGTIPVILQLVGKDDADLTRGVLLFSTIDNSRCKQALDRIKNLDQELEAFSYSISHDLRAPLRSIDGYSKILQEDYAAKLDEEGRRVLNVVMNNARRMGKLIDDLLDFGRLGRKNIQRMHVNMTDMVASIAGELRLQAPDRQIEVSVAQLEPAYADADMMRQVWYNLLDNAVKYTGKKELAAISVRSSRINGEVCYEVSDNGEGFDMRYVSKLFGVFQRLHKIQDFSGTGVGLAIVKRIVSRHGGRVWAEGALRKGATFYFTLPIENENA